MGTWRLVRWPNNANFAEVVCFKSDKQYSPGRARAGAGLAGGLGAGDRFVLDWRNMAKSGVLRGVALGGPAAWAHFDGKQAVTLGGGKPTRFAAGCG